MSSHPTNSKKENNTLNATSSVRKIDLDSHTSTCSSIPLLIKLPDGERRQVDFPPNSSVRDLKAHIASLTALPHSDTLSQSHVVPWDLDFAGSVLNENYTLGHYHIPDVYDHANGLLKTISDSGYDHPEKKVEAVDKALTLVRGISRGERDMERLIMSLYEDGTDAHSVFDSSSIQPSLNSMRRNCRSRIPSINLAHLPPVGSIGSETNTVKNKSSIPSAPPTPSQLIRRLSNFRPDLYDPKVIDKVASGTLNPTTPGRNLSGGSTIPPCSGSLVDALTNSRSSTETGKDQSSNLESKDQPHDERLGLKSAVNANSDKLAESNTTATSSAIGAGSGKNNMKLNLESQDIDSLEKSTSGELRNENTWFAEIMTTIGHSISNTDKIGIETNNTNSEVDGDSEGEGDENQNFEISPSLRADDHQIVNVKEMNEPTVKLVKESADSPPSEADVGITDQSVEESAVQSNSDCVIDAVNQSETAGGEPHSTRIDDSVRMIGRAKACHRLEIRGIEEKPAKPFPLVEQMKHKQVIGLEPEMSMTAPSEQLKIPKKRGRKRKNPHLTEDERKAQRQAQNRESAKLSRIRRKNMTIEYEKRVNTLEGENENLRDTVAALTGRLEMLQNLLTISVHKRAMSNADVDVNISDRNIAQTIPAQQASAFNPSLQHVHTASTGTGGNIPVPGSTITQSSTDIDSVQNLRQPNSSPGHNARSQGTDLRNIQSELFPSSQTTLNLNFGDNFNRNSN